MFVIEQPIPPAPAADSAVNVLENGMQYMMLIMRWIVLCSEKQAGVERFDLIQTFHACKQKEGKPVAAYVLKIKEYVEQLERLGYVLPQDEVGHWKSNYHVYLAELLKKKMQVGTASSSVFTDYGILVSKNDVLYFNAIPRDGIYEIDMHNLVPNVKSIYNVSNKRAKHNLESTYLWHCHLAHISKKRIEKLQQERLLKSTDDESFDQCVSCLSGKMTRKSFPHHTKRATDLFGIIHTNVCCPLRHVSRQGASYFITFTDNYSRFGYVYLLKHKHEFFETFKVFKNEVENQLEKTIKAFRSDRDMVRSMMNLTTSLLSFWDYALESTTCILNMVPTKKFDKTSYELWYGKFSNLSYLNVWGCEALVKQDMPDKLQQRSVKFSGRTINLEEIQDEDTSPSEITSKIIMKVKGFKPPQKEVIPIHTPKRTHQAPNHLCLNVEVVGHSLGDLNKPTSYKAVMLDPESNKWLDTMNAEMQSMIDNKVWVMVDLPPNCKTVGSKWIFKKKIDMDGILHTYKARLVANGYTQLYKVDYEEMFSPIADIRAIRFLISIAAFYDYEIWKMDVKTAFLNGYLDEDIYMVQPKGYIMYAIRCTRLDVAFEQNITSRLQQNPGVPHWTAVKSILKRGGMKSSKQSNTAMSATEAEYIAASKAAMEAVWIKKFILGL
nr:hypothetical protein [Tanacetum cinerariifolium]